MNVVLDVHGFPLGINNGLIVQYGRGRNKTTVTLPITFIAYSILVTNPNNSSNNNEGKIWVAIRNTLNTVYASWMGSSNHVMGTYFHYICIGY